MVKIEVYHDGEMWCARGLGVGIFTQGATLDEVVANIREAVELHFEDEEEVPDVLVISEVKVGHAKAAAG
jgi:hypothetical protein